MEWLTLINETILVFHLNKSQSWTSREHNAPKLARPLCQPTNRDFLPIMKPIIMPDLLRATNHRVSLPSHSDVGSLSQTECDPRCCLPCGSSLRRARLQTIDRPPRCRTRQSPTTNNPMLCAMQVQTRTVNIITYGQCARTKRCAQRQRPTMSRNDNDPVI